MNKPKVLICVDWYTPAFKGGGPIRSVANLVSLLKNTFKLYIFTSAYDLGDQEPLAAVRLNQWVEQGSLHIYYATNPFKSLPKIAATLTFHAVYVNSLFNVPFALFPLLVFRQKKHESCKLIIAPRGMLQKGALQSKTLKKQLFIKLARSLGLFKKVIWHATDSTEVQDVRLHFGKQLQIVQIPNLPIKPISELAPNQKVVGKLRMLYYSIISEKKNLYFLLEVISKLTEDVVTQLDVYGPIKDSRYYDQCLNMTLPAHVKVQYLGPVSPVEQAKIFGDYDLFVLPTKGENFGHAIFESLAHGLPVLISDQTPWMDLEEKNAGWVVPLHDPQLYLNLIKKVACFDAKQIEFYRIAALKYAEAYYASNTSFVQYIRLLS